MFARFTRHLPGAAALLLAGAVAFPPAASTQGAPVAERVSLTQPAFEPSSKLPTADRVVVRKGARRMDLLTGDRVLRSYRIALGLSPTGHKERSGDFRTPEGTYRLARRNARSDFFLSIQVSYPNEADLANAKRNGWEAGGSIMIHGLPNTLKHPPEYYQTRDWTDGCIAVTNSDMVEIWMLTNSNTPIDILP
jgi:murein L,D-transpeptidase YafK